MKQGLISETEIDQALKRLFTARFRLGMFDPPEMVPYAQIPFSANDSAAHRQLSLEAARESMVLLKNDNNMLPLRKDLKSIAVIGPNADTCQCCWATTTAIHRARQPRSRASATHVSPGTKVVHTIGTTLTEVSVVPVPASALREPAASPASVLSTLLTGTLREARAVEQSMNQ